MELELSRWQLVMLGIIGLAAFGMACIAILNWIAPKPQEQKYDYQTELAFLDWSICARASDLQMYIQNPKSTNPTVQKLAYDINLYNDMAAILSRDNSSIGNFSTSSCPKTT